VRDYEPQMRRPGHELTIDMESGTTVKPMASLSPALMPQNGKTRATLLHYYAQYITRRAAYYVNAEHASGTIQAPGKKREREREAKLCDEPLPASSAVPRVTIDNLDRHARVQPRAGGDTAHRGDRHYILSALPRG